MTRLQTATLRKRETLGRRRETLLKVTESRVCQTPTRGTFLWRWDLTRLPAQKQPSLSLWHPATWRTCEERRSNTSAAAFSSLFSSFCLFFLPRNEACRGILTPRLQSGCPEEEPVGTSLIVSHTVGLSACLLHGCMAADPPPEVNISFCRVGVARSALVQSGWGSQQQAAPGAAVKVQWH